jgi:flagellin-like hook-associated protein FlgL
MSGSISMTGVLGYAMMNRLIADSVAVHQKLDRLAGQASTGLVGDTYAGLGTGAPTSLDLRPQIANLQTWQSNVDAATGRMTAAQSALTQIQSIAANFFAQLNAVGGLNASAVDSIAASARDALGQVADLLDTQDGGVYVFAGQDTRNPPVPNPDQIASISPNSAVPYITPGSGSFTDGAGNTYAIDATGTAQENGAPIQNNMGAMAYYNGVVYGQDRATSQWYAWDETAWTAAAAPPTPTFFDRINAYVKNLGSPDSAATVAKNTLGAATYNGVSGSPSPFSDYLSTTQAPSLPTVQVGQNKTEPVGLTAGRNGLIPQPAPDDTTFTTTGSYMRDLLRALATIGSLSSSQANVAGFQDLVQNTRTSLSGAISAMAQDAGAFGNVQSALSDTQTRLSDTETALTGQVSSVENVDMAATLSQLSLVQTQMQASYQLIAGLSGLSLTKFLPAA